MMHQPIRVVVVDDSAVVRRFLVRALEQNNDITIAGVAENGQAGVKTVAETAPDLVILDIEMPVMDGLEALREIRRAQPRLPVIMFSTLSSRGAIATLKAISLGATDYVTKPTQLADVTQVAHSIQRELVPKIRALGAAARLQQRVLPQAAAAVVPQRPAPLPLKVEPEILGIGVSTGGPQALTKILSPLPADFGLPIVIVQHMPPIFTASLADRLNHLCALDVREAVDGEILKQGMVRIAPGDYHLAVARRGGRLLTQLAQSPPENSCRPAVDPLFRSLARECRQHAVVAILTGMGQDGLIGCRAVRDSGGYVVAQDQESSTIWGMPRSVVEAGLANEVSNLRDLPSRFIGIASYSPEAVGVAAGAVS